LIVFLVGARVTRVSSLGLPSSRFPPLTDELMVTLSLSLCLSPPIVCFPLLLFTSGATPTVYHFFLYGTEGGQHGRRRCRMVMMIDSVAFGSDDDAISTNLWIGVVLLFNISLKKK
jgi:hypothetical protein